MARDTRDSAVDCVYDRDMSYALAVSSVQDDVSLSVLDQFKRLCTVVQREAYIVSAEVLPSISYFTFYAFLFPVLCFLSASRMKCTSIVKGQISGLEGMRWAYWGVINLIVPVRGSPLI